MPKLKQKTIDGEERIKHFYSEEWFGEDGEGQIYMRYYTMPFPPKDDFFIPGLDGEEVLFNGVPFKVGLAHISGQDYKSHFAWLINFESGKPEIHVEEIQRMLPEANYIIVTTPITDTSERAYDITSELMDGFVGMLRLVGGNNLLRQLIREAAVDITTRDMKTLTRPVPFPQEIEGPFVTKETWDQFKEVLDAISTKDDTEGKRLTLATKLIEKAFFAEVGFKFFNYWVALEVAADTQGHQSIISLLAKAYGKNNSYVQNYLGFQHLWETRTAMFHHGESYEMPYDVERYMQCIILDVMRSKLELAPNGYMAAAVGSGFDVTHLNRNVAQAKTATIDIP
ncbi:MAG: hypothetical protein IH994_03480 [Proteobacteria bacterium]|nr:hypothetical protein [Pseudomonadota bacterium]